MSVEVKSNYAPPFIQKKRVSHFNPNTYRVLFEEANRWKCPPLNKAVKIEDYYTPIIDRVPDTFNTQSYPRRDLRHNNPQSIHCNFLTANARTLNAPLCNVKTHNVDNERHWIYHLENEAKIATTVCKSDSPPDWSTYSQNRKFGTRHANNPNINKPLDSTLTHNYYGNDAPRVWKEGLSFEHHYNSRTNPNYPIRGRRQGDFVWSRGLSQLQESSANGKIDTPNVIDANLDEFQHKLAAHRQFAPVKADQSNTDTVSLVIQPDSDKIYSRRHYNPYFTR